MPFEYPKHPNTGRRDPFRDEQGDNPFADDGPEADVSEDPYAVSASETASALRTGPTYRPNNFETTLPHRGGRVFQLGRIGLALSVLGAVGVATCIAFPEASGLWVVLSAALLLFGLPCSFTAWIMGRNDLRAIRSGAMDDAGLVRTSRGHAFGVIGTLVAIAPVVMAIVMMIRSIAEEL